MLMDDYDNMPVCTFNPLAFLDDVLDEMLDACDACGTELVGVYTRKLNGDVELRRVCDHVSAAWMVRDMALAMTYTHTCPYTEAWVMPH